jgi:hypothetical protein
MEGMNPWYGWWAIVILSAVVTLAGMAVAYRRWDK